MHTHTHTQVVSPLLSCAVRFLEHTCTAVHRPMATSYI